MPATRRLPLLLALLALLATGLAACGSAGEEGSGSGAATAAAETVAAGGPEQGAFPVTIEHKWGTTTIAEEPERVVVAGLREQDSLLALGIVPVATTEWMGELPGAIFPWAEDELGAAPLPEVLDFTDGLQFERIAALRPDLILAIYSGLSKQDYEKLSAIAPTVAQPPGQIDWAASWQDEITTVGAAVGRPAAAARLRREAEAEIAAVAREHPEFEGRPALFGTLYEGLYAYGPSDPRSKLLGELGFSFPPALKEIGGDEFGAAVADEEVAKLDVDALVWFAAPKLAAQIRNHPVYRDLDVHRQGRDVFIDETGPFYWSTSFISVLSLPGLLEGLAPLLAAAVDGAPKTATDRYSDVGGG